MQPLTGFANGTKISTRCGCGTLGSQSIRFLPGRRQCGRLSPAAMYLRGPTYICAPYTTALLVTAVPKLEAVTKLGQRKRRTDENTQWVGILQFSSAFDDRCGHAVAGADPDIRHDYRHDPRPVGRSNSWRKGDRDQQGDGTD